MRTEVPPVPPSQSAALIGSLSTMVMILGVVLVLCALPPVRAAVGDLADRLTRSGRYRPRPVRKPATKTTEAPEASPSTEAPAAERRRELDEFDLDIFSRT